MATIKNRIKRLEEERRFKMWVRFQRVLESFTLEQLEDLADTGTYPEPLVEPVQGTSKLDTLDRKALMKLWEEDQRRWAGRSRAELGFFAQHGHWPEEACGDRDCREVGKRMEGHNEFQS